MTWKKQSTLTGLAAVLFVVGLVLLLTALFRDASHGGPLMWIGFAFLIATVCCWFAASRADSA